MAQTPATQPAQLRLGRAMTPLGFLAYGVVAVRELTYLPGRGNPVPIAALLAAFLLLFIIGPFRLSRLRGCRYLYFPLQTALVQALGLIPPYQDMWGALYILLSIQALYNLPARAALVWAGVSAAAMILTLMVTIEWALGLGLGMTYVAACVMIVSWEVFSSQAEAARQESQTLLAELQQAHRQLQAFAEQVEAQSSAQERDRLAHELHDSVSQMIFAITLTAQSARLLLDQEPARVPEQLDRLQELTSGALGRMRSLISQWRPQ